MKKVLVITHDFPPLGKGTVLRPLKFCKYFKNYDWEPIVLTSTPKTYFFRDMSLLKEAEDIGIKIFRTRGSSNNLLTGRKLKELPNESKRIRKRNLSRYRKQPDEHQSWIAKAVKLGKEIIESNKIEIIYTTGPSFTAFLAARELKEKFKIPLVIDYQDSWLHSPSSYFPLGFQKLRNMKMEQDVIRVTDEIITANRRIKEYLIDEYDYLKHDDINIIHHGFDPDDFAIASEGKLPEKPKMRFTFAGNFFDLVTPKYFFEGLNMALQKNPEIRGKIEVCILGGLSKENLKLIQKNNISDVVINPGYVEHIESIKYLLASDVLWFMIGKGQGQEVIAPVRLAEYFAAKKPILACVPDGAAKQLLRDYDAVRICEPDEPADIAALIFEYYELYSKRMMPIANDELVRKFNIDKLTYQLVRYFEFLRDIPPEFGIKKNKPAFENEF
ncbi:MAG: glycosyltransferase [Ignavibacteria bacterium]|nr:glycosyltransferase [Ignavibacteria bacterium]